LQWYRNLTQPVIEHYRTAGVLCPVDGSGVKDDTIERVRKAMGLT
jgi:adenylate kinase family enzyme